VCGANSGLVNRGGGLVIDTQSDLHHARRMIELFGTVWKGMPKYVAITHDATCDAIYKVAKAKRIAVEY
jgi:cyclase